MFIKKNDYIEVISGKEKGRRGKVLKIFPKANRVLVEHINLVKKHTRPRGQEIKGGIIKKEAPLNVSNVMLVCNKCDKPRRIGYKTLSDGKKVRICRKCGEMIEAK